MSDFKAIIPGRDREDLGELRAAGSQDLKQRKLMLGALFLLLIALGIVIWHNSDFWFPETSDAESEDSAETSTVATATPVQPAAPIAKNAAAAKSKHKIVAETKSAAPAPAPPAAVASRTVLPPLEVEVVAGDSHRTVRPGSSSVHVNLQPGTSPQPVTEVGGASETQTAGNVTSNAAERVQMSADASEVVSRPVRPNYPLLARQMKVQGSVILQALIGKDGIIQNLRVVSGPHILASAAEDAVKQWHFKPHFQGAEAVETQAKITVNFTISTN